MIRLDLEEVQLPNGVRQTFEVVRHPGGAAVIVLDDQNRVCLLRQFRYVMQEWLWELPAGKIDHSEEPEQTARRELQEEAGVEASRWKSLGEMISSPGVFTERIHFYLATDLRESSLAREDHEIFEVHWIPLDKALQMLEEGVIKDAKTIIGLQRAVSVLKNR